MMMMTGLDVSDYILSFYCTFYFSKYVYYFVFVDKMFSVDRPYVSIKRIYYI